LAGGDECRAEKIEKGMGENTMKKIFEIPIYAMSKEKLYKKYLNFASSWKKAHLDASDSINQRCIEIETYPQRLWDYNHIVGYIKISADFQDIIFDVFLPTPNHERYLWKSRQKVFLYDISAVGRHFYVSDKMDNRAIQDRTSEMLYAVIKTLIPKRYYVDTEAFDHLNKHMDYRSVMEDA
jgi:hypothetical protein